MLVVSFLPLLISLVHAFAAEPATQIKIQVGGNSSSPGGPLQFHPNLVLATIGTIITFHFTGLPGNHSVTQSSFTDPCQPLAGGFDSGWVFVNESLPSPPEWNLTITDDEKPIWFYCKQLLKAPHCNAGMVGVINVKTTDKSLPEFDSLAAAATTVPPGQAQGGFVGIGASASGAPSIPSGALYFNNALATASPTATPPPTPPTNTDSTVPPQSTNPPGSAAVMGASVSLGQVILVVGAVLGIVSV
ncbi:hypothetical protein DFH09DRAFT_973460 [Mycena vulgaris]|nr:hypothetical protein DFH09DRAFT_973460 [Mycena vulgaris]